MNNQNPESFTNSKGVTFNIGDMIATKGSKIVRKIADIYPPDLERGYTDIRVRAVRVDGSITAMSVYANPDGIKHV